MNQKALLPAFAVSLLGVLGVVKVTWPMVQTARTEQTRLRSEIDRLSADAAALPVEQQREAELRRADAELQQSLPDSEELPAYWTPSNWPPSASGSPQGNSPAPCASVMSQASPPWIWTWTSAARTPARRPTCRPSPHSPRLHRPRDQPVRRRRRAGHRRSETHHLHPRQHTSESAPSTTPTAIPTGGTP